MRNEYTDIFKQYKLPIGRIVGWSKSGYRNEHPDNTVIFNANIITEKSGKIWYGDIDVTVSFDNLKDIANELNEDLYILSEHDARFENENKSFSFYKDLAIVVIKSK